MANTKEKVKKSAPKGANKKAPAGAKPRKLSAAEKATAINAIQDRRDGLIIASYGRTLEQLATALGGAFAQERYDLNAKLAALEADQKVIEAA